MTPRFPLRRWASRGTAAALTAIALTAGSQAALTGAQAAAGPTATGTAAVANPYSPAYHHPYRHGVVPSIPQLARMRQWARHHSVHAASASNLNYGGGVDGIGVTTGPELVYLVFWGSQWGSQGTDGNGGAGACEGSHAIVTG